MTDSPELSRAISHALRHEPWLYELELDEQGWVSIERLVAALRKDPRWASLTQDEVRTLVAKAGKRRHEIQDGKIRSVYGHSFSGRISHEVRMPPNVLFHGTSPSIVGTIRKEGLLPMGRQFVHLSVDREMAKAVGKRKSKEPVILVVDASAAAQAGVDFYPGSERVWLADVVPAKFIAFPAETPTEHLRR